MIVYVKSSFTLLWVAICKPKDAPRVLRFWLAFTIAEAVLPLQRIAAWLMRKEDMWTQMDVLGRYPYL